MPYNTKVFNTSLQMSTRGRIGIELSDGSILSAYHHWDSYTSWLGRILQTHYNSYEKASELIDGGDMSTCWNENNEPEYYSARGEDCPPRLDATFGKYLGNNEEFAYLFANGKWVCYNNRRWDDKFLQQVEIPVAVAA